MAKQNIMKDFGVLFLALLGVPSIYFIANLFMVDLYNAFKDWNEYAWMLIVIIIFLYVVDVVIIYTAGRNIYDYFVK